MPQGCGSLSTRRRSRGEKNKSLWWEKKKNNHACRKCSSLKKCYIYSGEWGRVKPSTFGVCDERVSVISPSFSTHPVLTDRDRMNKKSNPQKEKETQFVISFHVLGEGVQRSGHPCPCAGWEGLLPTKWETKGPDNQAGTGSLKINQLLYWESIPLP